MEQSLTSLQKKNIKIGALYEDVIELYNTWLNDKNNLPVFYHQYSMKSFEDCIGGNFKVNSGRLEYFFSFKFTDEQYEKIKEWLEIYKASRVF